MAPGRQSAARLSLAPLPMIVEDAIDAPPAIPEKSPRRLTAMGTGAVTPMSLGSAPQGSVESVPDRTSEALEKGLLEREWIAKRGGWYRLVLGALLVLGCVVGLAVGLALGLQNRNTPPPPLPTDLFPAGSYAFTTSLTSVSTSCITASLTWRCFPYSTFSLSNPSLSSATFYWVIKPVTSYSYAISSSDNPFAPSFSDIPLTLIHGNQNTERFTFNFTMGFVVTPSTTSTSAATRCTFNDTLMSATVWTRMRAEYPKGIELVEAPRNATRVFAPWPFRVEVSQVARGRPECRDVEGRVVDVDFEGTGDGECRCEYGNWGVEVGGRGVER
ncbi:hypothetical protein B0T16DRAFT_452776 [Cercophora newfieldiana]|uniref:Tat pathway signal sequence n=1 Tax=Cercophora newfieldiana TaxID=92897 RepID=A0AA39YRG9_9PEZI|nr:hypothetical protein B0T16DRAFT_452776 [Cercophora newfieldiana]